MLLTSSANDYLEHHILFSLLVSQSIKKIVTEARGLYLHRAYMLGTARNYCILKPYLKQNNGQKSLFLALKEDGFDYLLVELNEMQRLKSYKQLETHEQEQLERIIFQ